jgi:hypothetical protein
MNYAFMTALYLLRGDAGPDAVTEATLTDADVIGLAREVTFEPIDDSMPASVVVRYRDGRQIVVPPNIIDITGPAHSPRKRGRRSSPCSPSPLDPLAASA